MVGVGGDGEEMCDMDVWVGLRDGMKMFFFFFFENCFFSKL